MRKIFCIECHQILLNTPPPVSKSAKFWFSVFWIKNTRFWKHLVPVIFLRLRPTCYSCRSSRCFSSLHPSQSDLGTIYATTLLASSWASIRLHAKPVSLALGLAVAFENPLKKMPHTAENPEEIKTSSEVSAMPNKRDPNPKRAFARQPVALPVLADQGSATIFTFPRNQKPRTSRSLSMPFAWNCRWSLGVK